MTFGEKKILTSVKFLPDKMQPILGYQEEEGREHCKHHLL